MQIKLVLVLLAVGLSSQVLGSAIKGAPEHAPPPTKGLEAPAVKGRVLERQQQQRIEHADELPKQEQLPQQQLKEEQLQVTQVEEIRSTKTAARKEPARKEPAHQELLQEKVEQQKLTPPAATKGLEQPKQLVEEQVEEIKQTRYEAKPQIIEQQQQASSQELLKEEQVKLTSEQQRFSDYDKQEIELRVPAEEQRKLPEPYPIQQQQIRVEQQRVEQFQQQAEEQQQYVKAEAEPYSFSYDIEGSSRKESGDTKGTVRGQYTLQGADGSRRIVDYIADQDGFRASINTNEFGTEARSPAGINLRSSQPSAEDISLRLEGKTRESLQLPQQQVVQIVQEQYQRTDAVKGAPAPLPALPAPALPPAPVKGLQQVLLQQEQEPAPIPAAVKRAEPVGAAKKEAPQQQEKLLEESSKSAELTRREPKAIKAPEQSRVVKEPLRSFESATAHREYRQQAPKQVLRSQPAQVRYQQAPVRPQLTREYQQYPASPAQVHTRRYPVVAEPARNPRVSFYSPPAAASASISTSEEEGQPIGFDSRSS